MKLLLLPVIVAVFMLTGCNDPNIEHPVIEDLGMVGVMGFDYENENEMKISVTLPQPSKDAQEQVQQFSSIVKLPHQAMMDISTLTEKTLTPAQLRVLLFSEEFARKQGIFKVLENLYRDPQIGSNIFIAVVKGNAEDILSATYKDKPEINIYLTELLTPRNITAFSPFTTLHQFINRETDEVSDPSTPYLEKVDEDSIKITKVALFKEDKMVDVITPEEAKVVEAMRGKKKLPDISITIPGAEGDEEHLVMKFVDSKFHAKVNGDLDKPEIFLYLYVRGSVVDYDGVRLLSSNDNRIIVETETGKHIEDKVMRAVSLFQELGVEPIGLGEYFRLRNAPGWTKEKWLEAFKQADITTHVEVRIVSTGTVR
ncbi:Ger(x)C family spore germination protein [Halalkalibacter akibai]|uniref:Spore germination protein n=1 Tax=Halalkalibacter akibai (strain ATCC 43226 / DSM 21942 / CIP 109018 / JCM 9157 / 1139) TaxID=1236973 RepID=W4QQP9_HALA3|nr:Ger(x)C family spore germination protein [Halalkalibacter akibai]GAE34262.1 spore germination protein [Halalkalibacter akibai JCM 9157]